jgi:hypothetical protein
MGGMLTLAHASLVEILLLVLLSHAAGGREDLSRQQSNESTKTASQNWRFFVYMARG